MYVGVIYSPVKKISKAREKELLADCEGGETAEAVQVALEKLGHQVDLVELDPGKFHELRKYDWIFNLAESVFGFPLADHEIAARLEALGIPFTGSGSRTLKICADKGLTKDEIDHNGINTPTFQVFEPGDDIVPQIDFPLFVKPAHEDASIGITSRSVVYNLPQLVRQVKQVQRTYRQAALVEEFIDGRDISVAFLGNRAGRMILQPSECVYLPDYPGPRILTFDSKWNSDSLAFKNSVSRCPCELDDEMMAEVQSIGARAFHLLGCRDYARVDFRLKDGVLYLLEVNPNPCINPHDSGLIRAGAAAGLDYDEVIRRILEQSVSEWERVQRIKNRRHYIEYGSERTYPNRPIFINKDFIQY
jgi:D-alanine-D-alanine ligase